jgi:hypothetical protein
LTPMLMQLIRTIGPFLNVSTIVHHGRRQCIRLAEQP